MKEFTSMEVFAENAAEYITTGNRRIMDGTLLIYSSVTGSTPEIVKAVEKKHMQHMPLFLLSLTIQILICASYVSYASHIRKMNS